MAFSTRGGDKAGGAGVRVGGGTHRARASCMCEGFPASQLSFLPLLPRWSVVGGAAQRRRPLARKHKVTRSTV